MVCNRMGEAADAQEVADSRRDDAAGYLLRSVVVEVSDTEREIQCKKSAKTVCQFRAH